MQSVDLAALPVLGAMDAARTPDGVVFRRFPAWVEPQLADVFLRTVATMPAGVRLEFSTASRAIELDVALTSYGVAELPITVPAFDLLVDGELVASRLVEHADLTKTALNKRIYAFSRPKVTVRFDELPGDGAAEIEVWLPHTSLVGVLAVRIDDGTELQALPRKRRRWIHHGSSISHCMASPTPTTMWPAIVALRAGLDLVNLGFSGNCMLDQHTARSIRDSDADLISLKCGINVLNGDTMRERTFVPALHGFLDTVREGHPTTPLIVATPIICPVAEDHPGPTLPNPDGTVRVVPRDEEVSEGALTLRRIRELVTSIVEVRQADDPELHLMDGLALFGAGDLADLPDGLHPNPAGYRTMADRFYDLAFAPGAPFALAP